MTMTSQARPEAPPSGSAVRQAVREHLAVPDDLLEEAPTVTARIPLWRSIAVQAALDTLLPVVGGRVLGVPVEFGTHPTLSELLLAPDMALGPVDYVHLSTGPDETMPCIRAGLVLAAWEGTPLVAWFHPIREDTGTNPRDLAITVKCVDSQRANAFLEAIRSAMAEHTPHRGKSLKLKLDRAGQITDIDFAERPVVERDHVIMRPELLEAIETSAVGVGVHAERLRKAGRHLKRGLLLYGPPGTGKTHTIRYLASRLPDATLFVLTGDNMNHLAAVSDLLHELSPAIVVLDDVDLIAESRDNAGNAGSALFNLLDAMDGLREDVDVLFIATTNRPEELETAISARPGRIDQAIEVAVPDRSCRERLIALYAGGLDLQVTDLGPVLDRTAGVTASFIKELMRRAALIALDDELDDTSDTLSVTDEHLTRALDVLLDPAQPLTEALLGIHQPADSPGMQRIKVRGAGDAWCGI